MAVLINKENTRLKAIGNYRNKFDNYTHVEDVDKATELLYDDLVKVNTQVNELREREIQFQYYEIVQGTSSGNQINVPSNARILLDKFGDSGDAILSKISTNGTPTFESPRNSSEEITTTSLDQQGNYTFSSIPTDPEVALIYTIKIAQKYTSTLPEQFIITETELAEATIYNGDGEVLGNRFIQFSGNDYTKRNIGAYGLNADSINMLSSGALEFINTGSEDISLTALATGNVRLNNITYPKTPGLIGEALVLNSPNSLSFTNINSLLEEVEVKSTYEANNDTNAFTDAEKFKLASIEDSLFLGQYTSLPNLILAHPTALVGSYAYVDGGIGSNVDQYIWDNDDNVWLIQSGTPVVETSASVKIKYEANPDTNVFNNSNLVKLANIENNATADQTPLEIKTAYESNNDTNSFTDTLLSKLNGIELLADVTDTTNVDAAGATMNSDTTLAGNNYFLDEVDLVSSDPTKVGSQDSVKKYIDKKTYIAAIKSSLGLVNQTVAFEPFFIREAIPNVDNTGTWNITLPYAGDYIIRVDYRYSINIATSNFLSQVLLDGTDIEIPLRVETKDTGGVGIAFPTVSGNTLGGNINSGTDQFLLASGVKLIEGITANTVKNIRLEFANQVATNEACIYEAFISIEYIQNSNI